ncbi:cytochrome P450 4V3 [Whalleya microplaca]|nr:cytochrome P450 4V3 [Whalleya microplaca]
MEIHGVKPLLLQGVGAIIAVFVMRFLYSGYQSRMRVRSLKAQDIPILPHSLLFGHLPIFADFRAAHPPDVNIYVFHTWLSKNYKKYFPHLGRLPPVIYVDLWPVMDGLALVYDAVAASQFTQVTSLPKFNAAREFMAPLTANLDLVSTEGDIWKKWRSRFSPGFSPRNMLAMLPELLEEALVFVDCLKDLAGKDGKWGPVFKLEEKTTNLTFDIIARAALDVRFHEQTSKTGGPLKVAMMKQIRLMSTMANAARLSPIGKMPWHHVAIIRNNRTMRGVLVPQIENRLRLGSNNIQRKTIVDLAIKYVDNDDPHAYREKPDSEFINMLIANLKAFMLAGHDTTASTICFMTKLLYDNPECLAKLRAEHDMVLGPEPDKAIDILTRSPHILYSLPYTLGVIKETLRLYPLAASMRVAPAGFCLMARGSSTRYPMDGFALWVSAPGIQRNPDYWPRPDDFLPQRWVVAESDPLYASKEAWAPFSLGPRNCIGMELAMVELRLVSVLITRTFDIEEAWEDWDKRQGLKATTSHIVDGERLYCVGDGTVHPKDGMPVHVRLRPCQPVAQ